MDGSIEACLDAAQQKEWDLLSSPLAVQAWLDEVPYSADPFNRCPLRVLRDRQANCFDGALLAAARLRRLGFKPLILDLLPEPGLDDDHILALFRRGAGWGAVAKSNFSGLRYREPVYRNLRELVMSYFEDFYNPAGQKTLRAYTRPLDLRRFDRLGWEVNDQAILAVETGLDRLRPLQVLQEGMEAGLASVDGRSYQAGLLGSNPAGLFDPSKKHDHR